MDFLSFGKVLFYLNAICKENNRPKSWYGDCVAKKSKDKTHPLTPIR